MRAPLKIAKGTGRHAGPFAPIEDALDTFRQGGMIIVVDDEDRENEGDLTVAAEKITAEAINFMARYGRGLICLPMTGERLDELEIPLMVSQNTARFDTAFCVSIEAKASTSTGISAGDRAATVLAAIDPATKPSDLARPGHMFPLRARPGGVLVRAGQTEAAVDLARIAGLYPAGVICEVMNDDGTMARVPQLDEVRQAARAADDHGGGADQVPDADRVPGRARGVRGAADRIRRVPHPRVRERQSTVRRTSRWCAATSATAWTCSCGCTRRCLTGEVFHSARCDCGAQLEAAMRRIASEGPRRAAVPEPGRAGHRPGQQDPRVRAAGPGVRHRRGERAARVQGRPARLRHRRADPARPRRPLDAPARATIRASSSASRATAWRCRSGCRWRYPRPSSRAAT